ncbi:hypothetical protein IFR05_011045 [Cadophora sp. M221]|nr:hypothetical protein IFR05_011045 [Cadophora sp. M221]
MASEQYNESFTSQSLWTHPSTNFRVYDDSFGTFSIPTEATEETSFCISHVQGTMTCVAQSQFLFPYMAVEEPAQHPKTNQLVPVELAVEELIEDYDRRRGKHATERIVLSEGLKRRREQNRVSQRTFREKKAKEISDLKEKVQDLECRYNELLRAHEALQLELCSSGTNSEDGHEEGKLQMKDIEAKDVIMTNKDHQWN